ncbi:hypothetical protein [Rivibacter subsaxonicus]|uniref:Uncharacterized protein n=1 Tax=Rivibacter subsaxonicus TaxID=457575 RepID=A0A4Q7W2N0_9BURK|nr:hypothetical protein [Rivibacter subsaxonicus]RZU02949.1 hypothetical protein EV670_0980 [Rivibacter subsaxonicus]
MITQTLAAMTSLSTRTAIAAAAVALSTLQVAGLADMASADTPTVMLDRVEIVAHRDAQPSVNLALNSAVKHCATASC